jgi:hypothetical protein
VVLSGFELAWVVRAGLGVFGRCVEVVGCVWVCLSVFLG